jgi:hypothetical protein
MSDQISRQQFLDSYIHSVAIGDPPEDERTCPICLVNYGDTEDGKLPEDPVQIDLCKHYFGRECINRWVFESGIGASNRCPLDRRVLFSPARDMSVTLHSQRRTTFAALVAVATLRHGGRDETVAAAQQLQRALFNRSTRTYPIMTTNRPLSSRSTSPARIQEGFSRLQAISEAEDGIITHNHPPTWDMLINRDMGIQYRAHVRHEVMPSFQRWIPTQQTNDEAPMPAVISHRVPYLSENLPPRRRRSSDPSPIWDFATGQWFEHQ